ncbi:hypothetical protein SDC9_71152 [bioreactor metagenome]|uniref:Uncharacterized protein n=1 Tax=bioreactor metagenome TaxID=1076179 RepID=A0A644Y8N3_9ZZZZ
MKKLITTYTGGFPVNLDDLRWEQEATRDAFYGLMSTFGITKPDSFVLSGCVVTKVGNDYSWTDGYICLAGEVCKVVAGSVTVAAGETACWEIETAYDASGSKVFEDSTSHDCYEIRNAVLEGHTLTFPPSRMRYTAPTLAQVMAQKIGPYIPGTWYEVGSGTPVPDFENSWVNSIVTPAGYAVAYMKDLTGVVHLRGEASCTGGNTAGAIFTLPTGYRPAYRSNFVAFGYGASSNTPVYIEIETDGSVYILSSGITVLSLHGLYFHV